MRHIFSLQLSYRALALYDSEHLLALGNRIE